MATLLKLQLTNTKEHLGERINVPSPYQTDDAIVGAALAFLCAVDNFTHLAEPRFTEEADSLYNSAVWFCQRARANLETNESIDDLRLEFDHLDQAFADDGSDDWRAHIAWRNVQDYFELLEEAVSSEFHAQN